MIVWFYNMIMKIWKKNQSVEESWLRDVVGIAVMVLMLPLVKSHRGKERNKKISFGVDELPFT